VVHDVPLLVELGYENRYHLTVVVHADAGERVRRLVQERGSTESVVWGSQTGVPGRRDPVPASE